jgi:hypothetical protein
MSWSESITFNDGAGARTFTRLFNKTDVTSYVDTGSTVADQRLLSVKANEAKKSGLVQKFRQVTFTRIIPDGTGVPRYHKCSFWEQYDDVSVITSTIHDNQISLPGNLVALAGIKLKLYNGEL